jgi:hypothetical protein
MVASNLKPKTYNAGAAEPWRRGGCREKPRLPKSNPFILSLR